MDARKILMVYIEDNLSKVFDKVMVNGNGIMDKYFKDNGKKARKMVLVYGNLQKVIIIKVYGDLIDNMEKESSNIN